MNEYKAKTFLFMVFTIVISTRLLSADPVILLVGPPDGTSFYPLQEDGIGDLWIRTRDLFGEPTRLDFITLNGEDPDFFTATWGWVNQDQGIRHFTFTTFLQHNQIYHGRYQIFDQENHPSNIVETEYDTFSLELPIIELEAYDYEGGQFQAWPPDYGGKMGTMNHDYLDATPGSGNDFRPDGVDLSPAQDADRRHPWNLDAEGNFVFDLALEGIQAGEWLNYTRDFPSGYYEVYLRQRTGGLGSTRAELVRVGISAGEDPELQPLGTFLSANTGEIYRNIPLSESLGGPPQRILLSGQETLRLTQRTTDSLGYRLRQNYLVFLPKPPPFQLESARHVEGPFAEDAAELDTGNQQLRVPRPPETTFYRLAGEPGSVIPRIRSLALEMNEIVINYE